MIVAEAMVRTPRTLPPDASVAAARAALADDHIHLVLLTDGDRLVGTLAREDLAGVPDDRSAHELAILTGRTIAPTADAEAARRHLVGARRRRLAVVDEDGRLVGLLCLKRSGTGFCSDDDVAARVAERAAAPALPI